MSEINQSQESFLITTTPINSSYSISRRIIAQNDLNMIPSGRRSIRLRLVEDRDESSNRSIFSKKIRMRSHSKDEYSNSYDEVRTDFGTVIVSWFHGTTSRELQDHVQNSISSKLGKQVDDIRLLDEDVIPYEGKHSW